jgi:hypothetical protein
MRHCFEPMRVTDTTMAMIEMVNEIVEDYEAMGILMNLRQIYYQFISRDWFPDDWVDEKYNLKHGLDPCTKNTQKNYKRLGTIINKGRMAGHIDWDQIIDQTRELHSQIEYASPKDFMEKEALTGVIAPVCKELRVAYFACKGCPSQSAVYEARNRILNVYDNGEEHVILYLGDHDPTGLDIDRDIRVRLMKMTGYDVVVERIALTMDQVIELDPPPNPAKTTDARYKKYAEQYGDECWELDALEPMYMRNLVRERVRDFIDPDLWNADLEKEQEDKEQLSRIHT